MPQQQLPISTSTMMLFAGSLMGPQVGAGAGITATSPANRQQMPTSYVSRKEDEHYLLETTSGNASWSIGASSNTETFFKYSPYNLNSLGINFPDNYFENVKVYNQDLQSQLKLFGSQLDVDFKTVERVEEYTSSKIATLNCIECLLELSPDNSLKYTLLFSEGRMLMVNKPLMPSDEMDANDIVYSFFIDRKLVSADRNNLDAFIKGFQTYLAG